MASMNYFLNISALDKKKTLIKLYYLTGYELVNGCLKQKYSGFNLSLVVTEEVPNDKIPEFF